METIQSALHEMTGLSKQLIRGCEKPACDGTVLYTPDGVGTMTPCGCETSAIWPNTAET